jgi:hypothetical protein
MHASELIDRFYLEQPIAIKTLEVEPVTASTTPPLMSEVDYRPDQSYYKDAKDAECSRREFPFSSADRHTRDMPQPDRSSANHPGSPTRRSPEHLGSAPQCTNPENVPKGDDIPVSNLTIIPEQTPETGC